MATIDQQFVEYIVKTLVNNPDKVKVERTIDEKGVLLELTVDPDDIGRVIGRHGVTAQAMRVLLRALGTKQDARYNLKIENGESAGGRGERRDYNDDDTPRQQAEPEIVEDEDEVAIEEDANEPLNEEETETSDLAEKTRAELADLDDLDI